MTALRSAWTFYGFEQSQEEGDVDYASQIKRIVKVETAEEFWAVFSHLKKPTELPKQKNLHFFRGDARAMWEDEEHMNGGSFHIRVSAALTPFYWEAMLTNLICENFDADVSGVVFSAKAKYCGVNIWHRTATEELRSTICEQLCNLLKLPIGTRIDYVTNKSIMEESKETVHFIIEENGPVLNDLYGNDEKKEEE